MKDLRIRKRRVVEAKAKVARRIDAADPNSIQEICLTDLSLSEKISVWAQGVEIMSDATKNPVWTIPF